MKGISVISLVFLCFACQKDDFDPENPDPARFVYQLKTGTYRVYERGEQGEKLWTRMPVFREKDVLPLLELSADTSVVCPCDHFPVNPVSSLPAGRAGEGEACMMMGEYLLWCVEGVIQGRAFGSLVPVLADTTDMTRKRLTGSEILKVRELYLEWQSGKREAPPLKGTNLRWM